MNTTLHTPAIALLHRVARLLPVAGLLFAGVSPLRAEDACCAAKAAAAKPACCASDAGTAAFSRDSLYQLDATFTDDAGRTVSLGELRGHPVVITMFFASCGYACPLLVGDMQAIQAKLTPAQARDVEFVLVSFDVARDTPAALRQYREERRLDPRWRLLHGDDNAVRELAALLGVKYKQEADGAFSHSNLITILNAEGEVIHQRTGLRGGLDEAAAAVPR